MSKELIANKFLSIIIRLILRVRYRITVNGLDEVIAAGRSKILFLSNHPALIDPVILLSILYKDFSPHTIADQFRIKNPLISWFSKRFGAQPLPAIAREGRAASHAVRGILTKAADHLKNNGNLLLYPAGHLKRGYCEEIGARSAAEYIIRKCPDTRILLVRQNGLWGSSFSWAQGKQPELMPNLKNKIKYVLLNAIFFMPKRHVSIEFYEAKDFPKTGDRTTLNRFMEDFFNRNAWRNIYVPYLRGKKEDAREVPEPEFVLHETKIDAVSPTTRRFVLQHLKECSGIETISSDNLLSKDLGLDSLAIAEIIAWVQKEFGFTQVDTESLKTVGDVMLASIGKGIASDITILKPVEKKWFNGAFYKSLHNNAMLVVPPGNTIPEVFLNQAKKSADRVVIADQISGALTYRDLIRGIIALKPVIEKTEGDYIGIMLPASVGAVLFYLSALFAGKIPVMVNWTIGTRNFLHSLNLLNIKNVITADKFVKTLNSKGFDFTNVCHCFTYVEDIKRCMGKRAKLIALAKSYTTWSCLSQANIKDTAVVLFTSGSESFPKAVPLSHVNILSNIRDIPQMAAIHENDRLIGILPMFHSFGITVTTVMPLCMALPTVYYPNPNEASTIGRIIDAYKVTIITATPTFLNGILTASQPDHLKRLRLAISGAEKCPESLYKLAGDCFPTIKLLEGYGVTECSPIISVNPDRDPRPHTIGKVLPSFEYRIMDIDTGREAIKNQRGILIVRGPSVFSGYLKHDAGSPFVEYEKKLWYNTGDIVRKDDNGYLVFCGRLKRFIKLGGEMISLPAIEDAIIPHFEKADGEDSLGIAIEATSGEPPEIILISIRKTDRATVNRYIRKAGLSPIHNIRHVIKLDKIPLLGTGKTDYRALKELIDKASF
ncbi:MAG: AMP-binding protein [Pseudomonadota bacterium]